MILEVILHKHRGELAQYASVSREWLGFIEKETFRRLKLRGQCLDGFAGISRQRHLVKHVWLHIEPPGDVSRETAICRQSRVYVDNALNNTAINELITVLSTWEATGCVALELSVQSLRDDKHWFRNLSFGDSDEGVFESEHTNRLGAAPFVLHDPLHGWNNNKQTKPPSHRAFENLFTWTHANIRPQRSLKAPVITKFVMRRHSRRLMSMFDLEELLHSLPRAKSLVHESWLTYVDIARCPSLGMSIHSSEE